MYPKIIDNNRKNLFNVFTEISKKHTVLSIATGYWDLQAMEMLLDSVKNYTSIRLLIGKEPLIPRYKINHLENDFPEKDLFDDLQNQGFDPKLQIAVKNIRELIEKGILEVRVYKKNFLHAKCYIFGGYESDQAVGIIGSSNFTKNGLTGNTELNALESDHRIVLFEPKTEDQEIGHLAWFDNFWGESESWTGSFIELLGRSPQGDILFSPYEMYIKTLHTLYRDEIIPDTILSELPADRAFMPHQMRNIHMLMRKLSKKKVAMLADSVGLGKTASAIGVIREYRKGYNNNLRRVEVITPASLRKQWTEELGFFGMGDDELPITAFQNAQAIEDRKSIDKYAPVGLFVIDEVHNLRSINSKRYQDIMAWIECHPDAHVLLLTATPINNSLADLTNQILLGSKGNPNIAQVEIQKKNGFVVKNFRDALNDLEKEIRQSISDDTKTLNHEKIKKTIRQVVHQFVVRNTRVGVIKDPDFTGKFPIAQPVPGGYAFDDSLSQKIINVVDDPKKLWYDREKLFLKKINLHPTDLIKEEELLPDRDVSKRSPIFFIFQLTMLLGLVPYRWKLYQERFHGKDYTMIGDMKLETSESNQLLSQMSIYGIIRTSYLKRLESSAYSLKKSMEKYKILLENFKKGLEKGEILSFKKLDDALAYLEGDSIDEESEDLVVLDTFDDRYKKQEMLDDIKKDISIIDMIIIQSEILIGNDAKIKKLASIIETIKKDNVNNKKILIFSFFSDTIKYLEETLPTLSAHITPVNTGFATGGSGRHNIDDLANRFAPKAKRYTLGKNETEIENLFATDVLSEGQNLQDCGIIINYDLHWNPVRMIQRNGRINRLGSTFDTIYIYNMIPEKQLEEYLGLVKRLEDKISMINLSIGLDQPIFGDDFEAVDFVEKIEEYYTKEGLEAVQALEDLESSADLFSTEDSFVEDLRIFDTTSSEEEKKRVYEQIPVGKWGSQPDVSITKKRPEVIISGKLMMMEGNEEIDTNMLMFVATDSECVTVRRLDTIEALQCLKSAPSDRGSVSQKQITEKCQQEHIGKTVPIKMKYQQESQATGTARELKPNERETLKKMMELGCSPENMIVVRDALQKVNNEVRSRNMTKLLNAFKRDPLTISNLSNLIEYARESLKALAHSGENGEITISHVVPFLYHVS